MARTKQPSHAAVSYARALLELALERNAADQVSQELVEIRQLISNNPDFETLLRIPSVQKEQRSVFIDRVLGAHVHPLIRNFLGVLGNRNSVYLLGEIADAYEALDNERIGKLDVEVSVAEALDPKALAEVQQSISTALGKKAIVKQKVDPSVIGGLTLKIGDRLIDASVRSQLNIMRDNLLNAARKN